MFTDIVGSTGLRDTLVARHGGNEGNRRYRERFLDPHHARIRACLGKHNGFEVKTIGDSFMVSFASAEDAIRCAAAIQRSLRDEPIVGDESQKPLAIRIGIHTGAAEYVQRDGKDDYDGHAVNIAARVESLLKGGGRIYCSGDTASLAKMGTEIRFHSYGLYLLRGISEQIEIVDVLWDEAMQPDPPPQPQDRLPYPWLTKWVGREREMGVLVARDTVLVRMIDFRGISLFGGMYGRVLSPSDASEVIAGVRSKLRTRKGDVGVEHLQDPDMGRFLIDRWRDAVEESDRQRAIPPKLQNTDGDPLLLVTESFRFEANARVEIERRLAAMDEIDTVQLDEKESEFVFARPGNKVHKSWENTIVGRVMVTNETLDIETNSENRAAALGRRVRDACAGMLRDPKRKVTKPGSMDPATTKDSPKRAEMTPEELSMLRDVKESHYRDWIDTPIPALGGKTPRAAARTAKSRGQVDLLLREMENLENRVPEAARFDVRGLRRELGLDG